MKIILFHPTGNAFVRAAADGFAKAKILSKFYTSIALFNGCFLDQISKLGLFSELERRKYNLTLKPFTYTLPWKELGRQIALKAGFKELIKNETGVFSMDAGYRSLDYHVASRLQKEVNYGVNAVYGYEDGALNTFRKAKSLGLNCVYDLPIGYWRAARLVLAQEKERWPEWSSTLTGLTDSAEKLNRKDEELKLANLIVVASQFTANTLKKFPGELAPVKIVPYGFPEVKLQRKKSSQKRQPLKILFVGGLSQRKGLADLFRVSNLLKEHLVLTLVGLKVTEDCTVLNKEITKHTWIPTLAHNQILQLMRENDVLVLPSLFEGFGLVITEAMSQGTPVITTDRTAGPDLIIHGQNGWLYKAGSTEPLQEIVESLLYNPKVISEAGSNAMEAAKARPWEIYSQELIEAIR